MRQGYILLGNPGLLGGLLMFDPRNGNTVASLSDVSLLDASSSLNSDNTTGFVYDISSTLTLV